ncbi:threonine ammonia-lyase IlvA [Chryseobacterium gambrini]|uniref:L-threonine dehydratase n=2 Tax=Chryseobacterium TaxID=59732 RepID=A0AAJ1R312_9FLAO|nr:MULTISPECIES: threonine ammonia-lyase IlvA [Chryseobacterium]MDN4012990.1 threonine ammonia-lyase IlvA [Chryseobacterium gambrini]MDN4030733.1 threonine ammonia-lyase IlvA [Chryseobacterium gambrini]QWA38661.1 threonine ammonia-lyase IlvA [Chryseobacterium sp. ZHDP1]
MNKTLTLPTLGSVIQARKSIENVVNYTPLQYSTRLSEKFNAHIYLKREDLQPVRSYKLRGAYHKIKTLFNEGRTSEGIVCASAGNHAQGVAFSCRQLQIKGTIFMPVTTPKQKLEQVEMFGGHFVDIKLFGDTFDASKKAALDYAETSGAAFIHPFDDVQIIEGQATVALEILEQKKEATDFVFIPIGGGGLASGISTVFKQLSAETQLIGVEPKGAPSMKTSIENKINTELTEIDSFVDGAAVKKVGDLTFEICRNTLSGCISVDEGKICETILQLYNKDAIVLEPAGALSISALEQYKTQIRGKNVVCIVSGSNNDITRMEEIKERALLYNGLKHYFMVKFPQRPGALKDFVLNVLGTNDDITHFEYTKKNSRETALAIVGIELSDPSDFEGLRQRMQNLDYFESYLNENPDVLNMLV